MRNHKKRTTKTSHEGVAKISEGSPPPSSPFLSRRPPTANDAAALYCRIRRQSCRPLPHPPSLYLAVAVAVALRHRHR